MASGNADRGRKYTPPPPPPTADRDPASCSTARANRSKDPEKRLLSELVRRPDFGTTTPLRSDTSASGIHHEPEASTASMAAVSSTIAEVAVSSSPRQRGKRWIPTARRQAWHDPDMLDGRPRRARSRRLRGWCRRHRHGKQAGGSVKPRPATTVPIAAPRATAAARRSEERPNKKTDRSSPWGRSGRRMAAVLDVDDHCTRRIRARPAVGHPWRW